MAASSEEGGAEAGFSANCDDWGMGGLGTCPLPLKLTGLLVGVPVRATCKTSTLPAALGLAECILRLVV